MTALNWDFNELRKFIGVQFQQNVAEFSGLRCARLDQQQALSGIFNFTLPSIVGTKPGYDVYAGGQTTPDQRFSEFGADGLVRACGEAENGVGLISGGHYRSVSCRIIRV